MSTSIHDPSTGLHDIKPPPGFSPFPDEVIWIAVAAVVLLAWFALKRLRRKTVPAVSMQGPAPYEVLQVRLAEIEAEIRADSFSQREISSNISMSLRSYLEQCLHLPACEMTPKELDAQLDFSLRHHLPVVPNAAREELARNWIRVLKKCEKLSFQAQRYSSEEQDILTLLDSSRAAAKELRSVLEKEQERTRSVVEQDSAATTVSAPQAIDGGR